MQPVTDRQVREACLAENIQRIDHHDCACCGEIVYYIVRGGDLFFNAGCDCVSGAVGTCTQRTWQEAADWINMNLDQPQIAAGIARRFGLTI